MDVAPTEIEGHRGARPFSAPPPSLLPRSARRSSCIAIAGGGRGRPAGNPLHNQDRYRKATRRAQAVQLSWAQPRRAGAVEPTSNGSGAPRNAQNRLPLDPPPGDPAAPL